MGLLASCIFKINNNNNMMMYKILHGLDGVCFDDLFSYHHTVTRFNSQLQTAQDFLALSLQETVLFSCNIHAVCMCVCKYSYICICACVYKCYNFIYLLLEKTLMLNSNKIASQLNTKTSKDVCMHVHVCVSGSNFVSTQGK